MKVLNILVLIGSNAKMKNDARLTKRGVRFYFRRRKSLWEMTRLSFAIMGIEFTYAALTAFVSPVLLELGVNYQQMTMVWAISPVIGFFLSPVMGSLSDRCRLRYGRRRPFMVAFAVINIIGESYPYFDT